MQAFSVVFCVTYLHVPVDEAEDLLASQTLVLISPTLDRMSGYHGATPSHHQPCQRHHDLDRGSGLYWKRRRRPRRL